MPQIIFSVAFIDFMKYLIDANNLAGRLDLLNEENFDKILIDKLRFFVSGKKCDIYLVFDSLDPLGDKIEKENLKIIYTPRDSYYKNADDKIMELLHNFLENDEVILITGDLELRDKAVKESIKKGGASKLKTENTNDFVLRLDKNLGLKESKEQDDLSQGDIDDINKEMLSKFKNKKQGD